MHGWQLCFSARFDCEKRRVCDTGQSDKNWYFGGGIKKMEQSGWPAVFHCCCSHPCYQLPERREGDVWECMCKWEKPNCQERSWRAAKHSTGKARGLVARNKGCQWCDDRIAQCVQRWVQQEQGEQQACEPLCAGLWLKAGKCVVQWWSDHFPYIPYVWFLW